MTILVEETIKEFGYNANRLKKGSHKKILAACDDCGKVRTIRNSAYYAFCRSCSQKGKRNHMFGITGEKHHLFGKTHSEQTKIKMKNSHSDVSGTNNPMFGRHHSKISKEEMSKTRIQKIKEGTINPVACQRNIKSKPEKIFENICEKYNLPYKYTGNGSFWIENINPDFVNCNGKKVVVEIFGTYWHSPLFKRNIPYQQTYNGRKKLLKKYGWELVVFWQDDLKRKDVEPFVLNLLKTENAI